MSAHITVTGDDAGSQLTLDEVDAIVEAARRAGVGGDALVTVNEGHLLTVLTIETDR